MESDRAYHKYSFHTDPEQRYILLARLNLLGFDSFEETDDGWEAYLPSNQPVQAVREELTALRQFISFTHSIEELPGRNWNAIWEASFQPINVEGFCGVRADFHPPMSGVQYEIVINPKMAFGTGHHATTFMMLSAMKDMPLAGRKVLDYGCGTGILSILAAKLGGANVVAVDIEQNSYENSLENCLQNGVKDITVLHGTLDEVIDNDFDVILANINRNVILESLPALYRKLLPDGLLLISGILENDRKILLSTAKAHFFQIQHIRENSGWLSMLFKRP